MNTEELQEKRDDWTLLCVPYSSYDQPELMAHADAILKARGYGKIKIKLLRFVALTGVWWWDDPAWYGHDFDFEYMKEGWNKYYACTVGFTLIALYIWGWRGAAFSLILPASVWLWTVFWSKYTEAVMGQAD